MVSTEDQKSLSLFSGQRHHGVADIGGVPTQCGQQRDRDAGGRALDTQHRIVTHREALHLEPGLRSPAHIAAVRAFRDDTLKAVLVRGGEERRPLAELLGTELHA